MIPTTSVPTNILSRKPHSTSGAEQQSINRSHRDDHRNLFSQCNSPMIEFAAEHRKRRRRRIYCQRIATEVRKGRLTTIREGSTHQWNFSLPSLLLVLSKIIIFAQCFLGIITATNSNNPLVDHSASLYNNSVSKENNSIVEKFTDNIWKIQAIEEEPRWEWKAYLKKPKTQALCHVWNAGSPSDLCSRNRWHRIRRMRELSLFMKCPEGFANLQLIDIFQLDWRHIRTEEDLLSHSEHLRHDSEGQSCLLADPESQECLSCFDKLHSALERLEKAFWSFSNLLQRFDCRLVSKVHQKVELSATRPFSPNTTCFNCAEWYRKWLLVNLVGIWKKKPCVNWCYYTQLACPHLATNKVVEFAGHPVFLCRDQKLSAGDQAKSTMDCSCLHPCDLIQNRIAAQFDRNKTNNITILDRIGESFDFFHVSAYCQNREQICAGKH